MSYVPPSERSAAAEQTQENLELRLARSLAPVCWTIPIRWRQVFRASFARFFLSRFHAPLIIGDICLLTLKHFDTFGILDAEPVHAFMVLLLVVEALLFTFDMLYQILYYRTYFYDIRDNSVVIRRGVLCKKELTLPLARITDVYLDQDIVGRMLGLYDLHLSSPTATSGRFAHMVGIDRRGAHLLRKTLLELIDKATKQESRMRAVAPVPA